MGKKIIDYKTRRDASRGRKSKAGRGKKIKSDSIIYTPAFFGIYGRDLHYCFCFCLFFTSPAHVHLTKVDAYPALFTMVPLIQTWKAPNAIHPKTSVQLDQLNIQRAMWWIIVRKKSDQLTEEDDNTCSIYLLKTPWLFYLHEIVLKHWSH